MAVAAAAAIGLAACGGSASGSSNPPSGVVVKAPYFDLQGCSYVLDGTVPSGEPTGVQPQYSSFTPDTAAGSALQTIEHSGGKAILNGVVLPGGTALYAGPDASQPRVGTVPSDFAILAAEPVLWKDSSGGTWLAFFLSCGGKYLYWANLQQVERASPEAGTAAKNVVDEGDPTGSPPTIGVKNGQLVWLHNSEPFIIGRGEQYGPTL